MKQILLITTLFLLTGLSAQTYLPVDNRSSVKFIIKNFGMDVDGKFPGLEGNIHWNPADLKASSFAVSIDANTVNTDIDVRDNALREPDYLDAKQFPRINFASKQITRNAATGNFIVKGAITLKGIRKEISFPFNVSLQDDGLLFSGEFKLNRHDFKIGLNSVVLSDTLTVVLSVFAQKK